MTFSEFERILGFALPKSAYFHRAWWANGSHPQAHIWLDAGYKVELANLKEQTVCFCKSVSVPKQRSQLQVKSPRVVPAARTETIFIDSTLKVLSIYGYEFCFLQQLLPECDASGFIVKYYPQNRYNNKKDLLLSNHGKGAFCRFSINAGNWPGVYLWVVDNRIIYIGETDDLKRRFNTGYGHIAPRNCRVRTVK